MTTDTHNKCSDCAYAVKDEKMLGLYRCRFNPPTVLPAIDPQGRMGYLSQFPAVQADEWCAYFRKQPTNLIPYR